MKPASFLKIFIQLPCLQGDSRLTPGVAGHTFPATPSFREGTIPGSYPPGRSRSADGAGWGLKHAPAAGFDTALRASRSDLNSANFQRRGGFIPIPDKNCHYFYLELEYATGMSRRNAKHFVRQGGTAFPPQPTTQNCMDAVLRWKSK
jgi:hypothetical protein